MNKQQTIIAGAAPGLRRDDGNPAPGEIVLANEARFSEQYYSEPLTTFGIGFRDPNDIEGMLEFVAPRVPVGRRFEFKRATNAEEFYSEVDDIRAIGADFKRVEYTGESVNEKTFNKGLTFRADLDQFTDQVNWREIITGRLIRRIWRNDLRRAITALAAVASDTPCTWDASALKDPDMDILNALLAASNSSGIRPNRVLYGDTAWTKRLLALRSQNLKGQGNASTMTPEELAGFLGVDAVRISRERYAIAKKGNKSEVVGALVLGFYAEEGQTPDESSNIKRFVSACEGGERLRVYEQQISAKLVDITVEHYSNVVITSSLGIRKNTIS